jgi:hypothetical protein
LEVRETAGMRETAQIPPAIIVPAPCHSAPHPAGLARVNPSGTGRRGGNYILEPDFIGAVDGA